MIHFYAMIATCIIVGFACGYILDHWGVPLSVSVLVNGILGFAIAIVFDTLTED